MAIGGCKECEMSGEFGGGTSESDRKLGRSKERRATKATVAKSVERVEKWSRREKTSGLQDDKKEAWKEMRRERGERRTS